MFSKPGQGYYNRTMIRAHVDEDGKLVLPEGQSLDALRNKDVFVLVAPISSSMNASGETEDGGSLLDRQGVYRQLKDAQDQSLRFEGGVLVFDAGMAAEVVDAVTIERFIEQGREERLQFPQ